MTVSDNTAVVRQIWPLLSVRDINHSVEFHRDRLGFALVGKAEYDGEMFWRRLERDGSSIMLQQAGDEDGPAEGRGRGVGFHFVCDNADAMYADLSSRGLQLTPPSLGYYGMKQLFSPSQTDTRTASSSPTEDSAG